MSTGTEQPASSTSRYSATCSGSGDAITDADVNEAYNLFSAEQMRFYRGINVKLNRSFLKRKVTNPDEWMKFREVIRLCRTNGIETRCFIKFCFLNRLAPKQKGRTLKDVEYLTHYQQLAAYERDRKAIETNYRIYMSVLKSVMRMRSMSKSRGESVLKTVTSVIGSERISDYIMTGVVSRYFLSLIPNICTILCKTAAVRRNMGDSDVVYDFTARVGEYRKSAAAAMRMFWPLSLNKSVLELCC